MKRTGLNIVMVICLFCAGLVSAQSSEGMMSAGTQLLANGAFDQAVTQFRRVLERDPSNFEAQHNLAFAYLQMGRNADAVREFKKAIGLNGKNAETWSNLAVAYENLGNTKSSIDALSNAVNLDPNNLTARMNLATMYGNQGQLQSAISHYKQVIAIDGSQIDAYLNLSRCLVNSGQVSEAKRFLTEAINTQPNNAEAHWEMGNVLWKSEKNNEKALHEYQIAIKLQPNSQIFYENLGLLQQDMGKKQDALETWKAFLVYLDDALIKEKVQKRIDILEGRASAGGSSMPAMEKSKITTEDQTKRLQDDIRPEESRTGARMSTQSVDISNDFKELNSADTGKLDLKAEAKKRSKK